VEYPQLKAILDAEGAEFYRTFRRWQPRDLIPVLYSRRLLDDVESRFTKLKAAENELQTLKRADRYIKIVRRMQLTLRRAKFAWRADDLVFLQSIAEMYVDFGTILQMLKIDQARGIITTIPEQTGV
jgi:hypothetical protein